MTKPLTFKQLHNRLKGKTYKQVVKILCGKEIGYGCYRNVYECKLKPNYVVKIESDPFNSGFCNISEWLNYRDHKHWKKVGPYLAPCEMISPNGKILIQRRIKFKDKHHYPKKLPSVFTDIKTDNYGWIGKQFVCCDYAYLRTTTTAKMRKVKWK